MASIRDAILGLGQRIDRHQAQPLPIPGSTLHDSTTPPPPPPPPSGPSGPTIQQDYIVPPPPPPPVQSAPQAGAFVLHGQTETTPHSVVAPTQIVDDTQARIDKIEQRMRSLHVSDGIMGWDGYDDMPVAALPVEFRMSDIERYTGIGCPRIHLQLYNTVMRGHRLDKAQMIMLFPLSLSGAAQRWFASLDPSRRRRWADLGQEFIRQYSFIVDVSRRELEALRQGPNESVTSFISRWREKKHRLLIDLQRAIRSALYGIEEGISRGLWADSSPSDSKGKKSGSGPRPSDVGTIGMTGHRSSRCPPFQNQGLVDLGRPGVATDPLPTHDTRVVPPPPGGVHLIEFSRDEIFMMGWDGEAPQPISLYEESDFVGYIPRQQISRPFSLTPDKIVTRSGRIAQPPPVDRPFAGIAAREEVQREDDEILRQLRTTQARISIWSLLASSSRHRDALVKALGQIRVGTATTPERLIHMLTADRATYIAFSDDDLPPEGSNHVRPLFIDVACLGCRVPFVLLDNSSALNVCPLVTAIVLRFSPDDFGPSTQTVRAYDGTQRTVMGTLSTHVMIGPVSYSIVFQSDRDIITSSEPVLHISHSEDDLHLTGFTFDEVQVVSLEDGSRDMVPMSFDQHSSTLVLNMMRGMSYLPGMGLGRRQQGPHEFTFTVNHDTPYGLGYIPTEADAHYMSQLRRDRRIRICLIGEVETPSSPIRRQAPDVKYPEKVERRPDKIPDVRYPEKVERRKGDRLCVQGVGTPPLDDMERASLSGATPNSLRGHVARSLIWTPSGRSTRYSRSSHPGR
ncbi:hypothetical protein VitviT2T_024573 [Vitis vinifera]|uniref:Retrotransposon gag domain-containing protein n=1 Tax=Vitis vinifera TaxID=29760 RepID=A0ABY9DG26_VITVI|nr:hypothetical protein VitviT2T_024573 [Vitis vinifera]